MRLWNKKKREMEDLASIGPDIYENGNEDAPKVSVASVASLLPLQVSQNMEQAPKVKASYKKKAKKKKLETAQTSPRATKSPQSTKAMDSSCTSSLSPAPRPPVRFESSFSCCLTS
jgi:hypothetical protein